MGNYPTWSDFVKYKESDSQKLEYRSNKDVENAGEDLDRNYRKLDEYEKMLDFLRGRKNVKTPPAPPKEAPKGWFIVDEQTGGYWDRKLKSWSRNPNLIQDSVINNEDTAKAIAEMVSGIIIPAEEILS